MGNRDTKFAERRKAFCREYVVDFCGAQAAIRAGYSKVRAKQVASELLARPDVAAEVKRLIEAQAQKQEATVEWVISMLVSNARRAAQAEPVFDKRGNPTGEYAFDGATSNRALELIGKHLAMFTEKVKHEGELTIRDMSDEELDAQISQLLAESGFAGAAGGKRAS